MRKTIILIILLSFIKIYFAQSFDLRFLKMCNAGNLPVWDKTMIGVSFSAYPAIPLTVGGIWGYGYYKHDKEMMRNGYKSAITIGLAVGVSYALKVIIKRDRPYITYPRDIIQRAKESSYSFPSGHTTSAFATATALSLSTKKWQVIIPSYLYAGFVGYSRLRLGVHYPSDVLAGALIGVGTGFLVWQVDKWMRKNKTSNINGDRISDSY